MDGSYTRLFKGDYRFVLPAYEDYEQSRLYPYPGGRASQPQWLLDDFDVCSMLKEQAYLNKKHGTSAGLTPSSLNQPPPKPLTKFSDIVKGGAQNGR